MGGVFTIIIICLVWISSTPPQTQHPTPELSTNKPGPKQTHRPPAPRRTTEKQKLIEAELSELEGKKAAVGDHKAISQEYDRMTRHRADLRSSQDRVKGRLEVERQVGGQKSNPPGRVLCASRRWWWWRQQTG